MSVTPEDWLNEARRHVDGVEEISLRTAISRGYYAAYHQALTVKPMCPAPPPLPPDKREGVHAALIRQFRSAPKNTRGLPAFRQISAYLAKGHALRVIADYKLDKTVCSSQALDSIDCAEQINRLTADLVSRSLI